MATSDPFNLLCQAGDWTHASPATRATAVGFLIHCATMGTPSNPLFIIFFLGPHPRQMEVPRIGVKSELQLLAYAATTAIPVPSLVCDLQHSSWQHQILNPLSGAREWTRVLLDTSWFHFCWATTRTPEVFHLINTPQFLYPFCWWQTWWLFLIWSYQIMLLWTF